MILLPRRAFLTLCALTLGATAFLLLAAAAQRGRGPLASFARGPLARRSGAAALCPALGGRTPGNAEDAGAVDAYLAITTALERGSLARVPENAAHIAEVFGTINPSIAASARRLARLHDLPAARREFQRLTDLFSRRPDEPDGDDDTEEDESPNARSLEV